MLNLNENEERVLKYWEENKILEKARQKNSGKKPFYFLDGPPYVTGELHPGQIWVKSVKDIFIRYKRMRGYDVHDRTGFDVHGLPVENKIERTLDIKSKKEIESTIGVENFVKECRKYVDSLMPGIINDFKRFGSSLDFKDPYIAYRNDFIETAWALLKEMHGKGLLYTEPKPMLFCPHCETVLAQGSAEVVYSDEKDPSIFVAFKIDQELSNANIEIDDNTYLVVWTTTPWTLPANISVAVNPKERYVKVSSLGKHLILAKTRLDIVMETLGENAVVESEFYGSELRDIHYINPLEQKIPKQREFRKFHKAILEEEMVSSDEGSGIVHIAPGHGTEDYFAGKRNKLPIFSPVTLQAKYNDDAGAYSGLKVPSEANTAIISELKNNGSLLDEGNLKHSYPHCWRCNSKLLFLTTRQWFLNVQKVKKKLISENKKVSWHPAEAQAWFEDVLQSSPDWSIARQRYWGIPIPIWECAKCNHINVVGSLDELASISIDRAAVDALDDLHRPYIDDIKIRCNRCGGQSQRIKDVFDVWFDSGIAFRSSLSDNEFKNLFPAAFVLEGKDQLRGWFSTLLKTSVMVYGKAPYKNVVIDGMLLAEDGREMHKSWGNYVPLKDLLSITSADSYRLWCSNHTQWLDLQFKKDEIKEAEKKITVLYNVFNLFNDYSNAIGYNIGVLKKPRITLESTPEDLWILSRLATTADVVGKSLDCYSVQQANNAIGEFLLNDLSRFYLKIAKKSIIYGSKSMAKKKLNVIKYLLYNLTIMLTPFIPFAAEHLYIENYKRGEGMPESITLLEWPNIPKGFINNDLENQFAIAESAITAILSSREKSEVKLRWPISEATVEVTSAEAENALQRLAVIIEEHTNARHLNVKRLESFSTEIRPEFSKIGPAFREKSAAVAEALKSVNAVELTDAIAKHGTYLLHTSNGIVEVNQEHFVAIEKLTRDNAVKFSHGVAYIDPKLNAELMEEALIREFERRVQLLRKDIGLKKVDKISVHYAASPGLARIIAANDSKIKTAVGAKHMKNEEHGLSKEFDIEGETARIFVEKL